MLSRRFRLSDIMTEGRYPEDSRWTDRCKEYPGAAPLATLG
ncbi:hypothetical protein [Laspinema palackyanum]